MGELLSADPWNALRGVISNHKVSVVTAILGATIARNQSDGEYAYFGLQ